mmetsp:Transcript_30624/g.107655  ORF Transcript_30624/g.107655 Transcript_30624/m.107655 type:complete len:313 (+) Transcript_30624:59-997(+)
MALTRVELTLDSGHQLLPLAKGEPLLDDDDVELRELRRLHLSAKGDRRDALQSKIDALQSELDKLAEIVEDKGGSPENAASSNRACVEATPRGGGARPWSARPMSARKQSVKIMKTIPELKQHVRPLSSKRGDLSEPPRAKHDWGDGAWHKDPGAPSSERRRSGSFSDDSDRDEWESAPGACRKQPRTAEVRVWASSHDARHPARDVCDASPSFWVSSGLYPQVVGYHFTAGRPLSAVHVWAVGARKLRLRWSSSPARWSELVQVDTTNAAVSEFVFNVAAAAPIDVKASLVQLEVVEGSETFCVIRHVKFL